MKRSLIVAFAIVMLSAVAGVALIAQEKRDVKFATTVEEAFQSGAEEFDATAPTDPNVQAQKKFIEAAASFAKVASIKDLNATGYELGKRAAEIQASNEAAVKEAAAEKAVHDAEHAMQDTLSKVIKQYPDTEASKRAKTLLESISPKFDPFATEK